MVETGVLRVSAQVPTPKPDLGALRSVQQDGRLSGAPNGSRDVYFPGAGYVDTMVYKRSAVAAGTEISGPAVLEEMDSTVVLPPGSTAKVDDLLNIVIEV
jgi:N-methylhydantoinase A